VDPLEVHIENGRSLAWLKFQRRHIVRRIFDLNKHCSIKSTALGDRCHHRDRMGSFLPTPPGPNQLSILAFFGVKHRGRNWFRQAGIVDLDAKIVARAFVFSFLYPRRA
jgi:hypothetical protein